MEDEAGNMVACRMSHEALRDHADTDGAVFDANRELIEGLRVTRGAPRASRAGFRVVPRSFWHKADVR